MATTDHMLSTIDNPFSPYTQWDEWFAYDEAAGYHTLAFLARIVRSSDDLSDTDQSLAIEQGMQEIIAENVNGLYILVDQPAEVSAVNDL